MSSSTLPCWGAGSLLGGETSPCAVAGGGGALPAAAAVDAAPWRACRRDQSLSLRQALPQG